MPDFADMRAAALLVLLLFPPRRLLDRVLGSIGIVTSTRHE